MPIRIFDMPGSSNALKVRHLLHELDLDYERIAVDPINRPPELYAINPLGGVPTIIDGDTTVAESHAILRYLARREGRYDLYPGNAADAARVDEFLERFGLTFRPAFFRFEAPALGIVPGKGVGAADPDPAAALATLEKILPTLTMLDSLVGGNAWAIGDSFTVADCAISPILFRTTKTGMPLDALPNLARLREAIVARPAFQAAGPVT